MELNIPIRPTSSIYATYRRLSYKPWFAVAEFVDNSTQSYFNNSELLKEVFKKEGIDQLQIEINYDPVENTLEIVDNAYGMEHADFFRAVILDSPPPNRSGRSEYGMGLKTAACWFGAKWTVESTQLGSTKIYSATIDVRQLAESRADSITGFTTPTSTSTHFTKVKIYDLYHPLRSSTVTRIKEQLGSMYRQDIRSKEIIFRWNGTPITFEEQPILVTTNNEGTKVWKQEVEFTVPWEEVGISLPVRGWIGIRKVGKQRDAGFVLLRRGRVIQGGPGEGYRPAEVFGAPNMFRSQRLIGELCLDEWPVTQAKDQFDWSNGLEDAFIEKLAEVCKEYGDFADSYRAPAEPKIFTPNEMDSVTKPIREIIARQEFGNWLKEELKQSEKELTAQQKQSQQKRSEPEKENNGQKDTVELKDIQKVSKGPIIYSLNLDASSWILRLHWQSQLTDAHWLQISHISEQEIDIYLNTAHPFVTPYIQDRNILEFFQKLIVAFVIAEKMALSISHDGRVSPADFRILMNKILKRTAELEVHTHV